MQALPSITHTASAFPSPMKAIEKSARDPNVKSGEFNIFGKDGLGFDDVLDAVNPLNYIPGVSSLYQGATGNSVSPILSMASGALLGGPLGFVLAAISSGFEMATGATPLGHVIAFLTEDTAPTQIASNAAGAYQKAQKLT